MNRRRRGRYAAAGLHPADERLEQRWQLPLCAAGPADRSPRSINRRRMYSRMGSIGRSRPRRPKPPRKKHSGWIVAVAIVAAVGVIGSVVLLGLSALKVSTDTDKKEPTQSSSVQGDASGSGDANAPSLNITSWDDDDGGLSTREVINRNLDCTVSLTVYTQAKSFQFGESSLTQAGVASGIIMSSDGYVITNWHCAVNEDTGKDVR